MHVRKLMEEMLVCRFLFGVISSKRRMYILSADRERGAFSGFAALNCLQLMLKRHILG